MFNIFIIFLRCFLAVIIFKTLIIIATENRVKPTLIVTREKRLTVCENQTEKDIGCYSSPELLVFNLTDDVILATNGDRFTATCKAQYLTRWMSNVIPTSIAEYREYKRFDQDPLHPSETTEFISEFMIISNFGTSGSIRCEHATNVSLSAEIYIFAQSSTDLVAFTYPEISLNTSDVFVVPCTANYPAVHVSLLQNIQISNNGSTKVLQVVPQVQGYDPRRGFLVLGEGENKESYECKSDNNIDKTIELKSVYTFVNQEYYNELSRDERYALDLSLGKGQLAQKRLSRISCVSNETTVDKLVMIRCRFPFECDWLKHCFQHECTTGDYEKRFELWDSLQLKNSKTLRHQYPRGMVQCTGTVVDTLQITTKIYGYEYFFTGLDRISYLLSDTSIPETALMRLTTDEQSFYTDKPVEFICEISTFLFISNIKFAVGYKNLTRRLLEEINPAGDRSIIEFTSIGYSRKRINVSLTTDMEAILCLAPWHNSSAWYNISRAIAPKDIMKPEIEQASESTSRVFYLDEGKAQYLLHCSARGEPKPEISWMFPNDDVKNTVKYNDKSEGESTITFSEVSETFEGNYTCVASNLFGIETLDFNVKVEKRDTSLSPYATGGIIGASIGFVILLIGIVYLSWKYHSAKDKIRDLTEEEINEFNLGNPEANDAEEAGAEAAKNKGFNTTYVIPEDEVIVVKSAILGEGEYGMVYRGFLNNEAVAIKTTKPNADVSYFKAFLGELKIMGYIGRHDNLVIFRGAVVSKIRERMVYCVVELSPFGNLHSHLRKISPEFLSLVSKDGDFHPERSTYENVMNAPTTLNLIDWCQQIANGMDYLAGKKVIHGDLATRNILVFRNNVVKITDFGLSRQLYGYSSYVKQQKAPLPWRWMAIESLRYMEFSSHSDMWSFGITMWEIFSLGETPYPGLTYSIDFVDKLVNGLRMGRPYRAPKIVYKYIADCWNHTPAERPSFMEVKGALAIILQQEQYEPVTS